MPLECNLPFCEPDTGNIVSSAISSAMAKRGYRIVERWGGPDFLIQGSITDFDTSSPDALLGIELRIMDAKTGRLAKIVNASGSSNDSSSVALDFPRSAIKWKGKPIGNAFLSAVGKIVDKVIGVIGAPDITGEEKETFKIPASKQGQRPTGIISGGSNFSPGENLLFESGFSRYNVGDLPKGFKINGQVEIAEMGGKKWLRALSKNSSLIKAIDLPDEWSLELDYYFLRKREIVDLEFIIAIGLGRTDDF